MPVSEFNGWQRYLSMEPSNSVEIQTALVAQVASNAMGGKASLQDMLVTHYTKVVDADDTDAIAESRPTTEEVNFIFSAFRK